MQNEHPYAIALRIPALLLAFGCLAFTQERLGELRPLQDSDFYAAGRPSRAQVELGRMLFFDKLLSGNKNIACASCHHPRRGTSDDPPLFFGEGALGLGKQRRVAPDTPPGRVPRNAQALYMLGAKEFASLFHDGRVELDPYNWPSGFRSPAREQLPEGLESVLAAQAMFPVLSPIEMAGHRGENAIADAVAVDDLGRAWELLAERLRAIPEYVDLFQAAYPQLDSAEDIGFVHAANAIAAFEATAFRADDSPFDRYLRSHDLKHLSPAAQRGMALFYGAAGCSRCHSGPLQTDQRFHAIAMPQLGPGKGDGWDQSYCRATGLVARLEDHGRYRVSQRAEDRYRFRTPTLRNVELTGPWGHSGAYVSLAAVVRHHLDPQDALERYTPPTLPALDNVLDNVLERTALDSRLIFRPINPRKLAGYIQRDGWVMASAEQRRAIAAANELEPIELSDQQLEELVAFLQALTDPRSRDQSDLIPARVPSGLPVDH